MMMRTTTGSIGRTPTPGARVAACSALLPVACAALLVSASAHAGALEDAGSLAERTASLYERSSSYRIEFIQESYWALADSTIVSGGVLLAEPPTNISIEYEDGGRVVSTGDSIWVFVPQTNQFYSAAVDSADVSLDLAALLRRYSPDPSGPFGEAPPGSRTLRLKPDDGFVEPEQLAVTIDGNTGTVTLVCARSTSGDTMTYRMIATTFDAPLPEGTFSARRPSGAELVRGQLPGAP